LRKQLNLITSGVSGRGRKNRPTFLASGLGNHPDVDIALHVGRDLFLDEKIPRHASGQGYVRVVEHSVRWKETAASKIFTYQGSMTMKRGDVEVKLNTVNMTVWVHKECDIIEEEAVTKLQEAWESSEQKDECTVCLDDLEQAYWMGTEVGLLVGYGFQGVTWVWMGRAKMERWDPGAANSRRKVLANVHELAARRKARAQTGQSWEGLY
jgi:hypothetical protein